MRIVLNSDSLSALLAATGPSGLVTVIGAALAMALGGALLIAFRRRALRRG